jgi:hypothetical protein
MVLLLKPRKGKEKKEEENQLQALNTNALKEMKVTT